jgi:hypothetical protein
MKKFKSMFKPRKSTDPLASHDPSSSTAPVGDAQTPQAGPSSGNPQIPESGPSSGNARSGNQRSSANKEPDEPASFNIRVDTKMWPAFDLGEDTADLMKAGGQLYMDYTDRLAAHWATGTNVGSYFGRPLFTATSNGIDASQLPPVLFDLAHNRIVRSSELEFANYAVVSHVWGPTMDIDGLKYGVDWKIPIKNENKLLQILEAARVVIGERYIWMDVLCMDQRKRNEVEIANMKSYFANATGCFVWLDNCYDDPAWKDVLNAIEKVNSFFNLDQHGTPFPGALDRMFREGGGWNLSLEGDEAFIWIREFVKMATAPWFRRVWTLQEGVIPDRVYFCTPERYMTGGAHIWTITALCEMMANIFLKQGTMMGTAITHELQRSEIHKMLKLRQLYRKREISYWHLAQAVRTRECKYEQDRVFGVCGMIHGTIPVVNYDRSIEGLYEDLYKTYIDDGDFTPCQFIGGRSLLPDKDISMGYIRPMPAGRTETHSLVLTRNGLRMDGIGIDKVTRVHCLLGTGPALQEWNKKSPEFMSMPFDAHIDVARAFELEPTLYKDTQLCPASFAAMMSLAAGKQDEVFDMFGKLFEDLLHENIPPSLLQWIKATYLMQNRDDSALTMIWTQSSAVQLAVVTEPVEGAVIAVMPSSYKDNPGAGCLLCKVFPNGNVKKIGIGLGKAIKASELGTFLLIS